MDNFETDKDLDAEIERNQALQQFFGQGERKLREGQMVIKSNGFPVKLFTNDINFLKEFVCSICKDIVKDPKSCQGGKNGHNFCFACIDEALQYERECPVCKAFLKNGYLHDRPDLKRRIVQLTVTCSLADNCTEEKCSWTGPLGKLKFHQVTECGFRLVKCPMCQFQACKPQSPKKLMYKDMEVFIRTWSNCEISNGYGTSVYPDGTVYCGEFNDRIQWHGVGIVIFTDGQVYMGEFRNGNKNGLGMDSFENGAVFFGNFLNGVWTGQGLHYQQQPPTSHVHHSFGNFVNGCLVGRGWSVIDGVVFFGDFENGRKLNGMVAKQGVSMYFGQLERNYRHGVGVYITRNGVLYRGEFHDGLKHGKGKLYKPDGTRYEGEFQNGRYHGIGLLTFPPGESKEDGTSSSDEDNSD